MRKIFIYASKRKFTELQEMTQDAYVELFEKPCISEWCKALNSYWGQEGLSHCWWLLTLANSFNEQLFYHETSGCLNFLQRVNSDSTFIKLISNEIAWVYKLTGNLWRAPFQWGNHFKVKSTTSFDYWNFMHWIFA